jgi:hypothetical protein
MTMEISRAIAAVDEAQRETGSVSGTSALSERERIFVDAFIGNGGKAREAALEAGCPDGSAHVEASRMLCRKRVGDAILARCSTFAHACLPVAIRTLVEIAGDAEALRKDRIKAANSLVELTGLMPRGPGVQVNVGVAVNGQQAQAIIESVHQARQARLSDIPPAMSDTLQEDLRTIEALALPPADDPPGGDQLQGPGAGTCPVPVSQSARPPISDVSERVPIERPRDPFGNPFDSQGEDDARDDR